MPSTDATTRPSRQGGRSAPLALSTGEPAGVGPDLTVRLAQQRRTLPWVALADPDLLASRAHRLGLPLRLREWTPGAPVATAAGELSVRPVVAAVRAVPGRLDPELVPYVLELIREGALGCLHGRYAALVTAPVHKGVIARAGVAFTGHTEYLAQLTGAACPVMLLHADGMRVALATTHVPLREVAARLSRERLQRVLEVLLGDLRARFRLAAPRVTVCGLNPHAGEQGALGAEDRAVIAPVVEALRAAGHAVSGPVPADTAFTPTALAGCDAVLAMYHDQGLPVLKAQHFDEAVNVTLGLPIVRTSVDHGTALELAGTDRARPTSLAAALRLAAAIADIAATP